MAVVVGMIVHRDPVPPIPENTRMVDAGAVSFGIEYRFIGKDVAVAHYGKEEFERIREENKDFMTPGEEEDDGVSIHVFGDDGVEYLRFDCFSDFPHYHYLMPRESWQRVVTFDALAHGDMLDWTLGALRSQLDPLMRESGGGNFVDRIDAKRLTTALDEVGRIALGAVRREPVA